MHKNKDGVFAVTPDSLKHEFTTQHGRRFLDAGGIAPDSLVPDEEHSSLDQELIRKAMFFKFATHYISQHPAGDGDFVVSDALFKDFEAYLKAENFEFKDDAVRKLSELKDVLHKEKYSSTLIASLQELNQQVEKEKATSFSRHAEELREELHEEIVGRYAGERGRIKTSLAYDEQVQTAVSLLASKKTYVALLAPGK